MYNIITHYWYIIGLSIGILSLLLWGIVYFLPVIGKKVQQPVYKEENKDLIIQSILIMLLNLDEYYFNYFKKVTSLFGSGLCHLCIKLIQRNLLSKEQFYIISDYIQHNEPQKRSRFYSSFSETSDYYWPRDDIEIRRKWLLHQLDLLTNTYQG